MSQPVIMLRYGEMSIKGRNKKKFQKKIYAHLNRKLEKFSTARMVHFPERTYIFVDSECIKDMCESLKDVFGLHSLSAGVWLEGPSFEEIVSETLPYIEQYINYRLPTFRVTARRADKSFSMTSPELQRELGKRVLDQYPHLKVDVHHSDWQVFVEVREEGTIIYHEYIYALGGFPVGSNGKACLLLSGGIDSPVAGFFAMKKGLEIEAIHFHSYPYTSKQAQQKVEDLARKLAEYQGKLILHTICLKEIMIHLKNLDEEELLITLMRRIMMRIASKVANERQIKALLTGESLGQVASQTLSSMCAIEKASELPILRPLVMFDKQEIITWAKKIDTYETSILPYEDCCTLFVPQSPSTNPNAFVLMRIEEKISEYENWIGEAIANMQTQEISVNKDWLEL